MERDPVCGKIVDERSTPYRIETKGRVYYFCSRECLNIFIHPEKEKRILKYLLALSLFLNFAILLFHFSPNPPYPRITFLILLSSFQWICTYPMFKNFFSSLRKRMVGEEAFFLIPILLLWFFSLFNVERATFFHVASTLITISLLSSYLKLLKDEYGKKLERIEKRLPSFAEVEGKIIPVEELKEGDVVEVKTGEKVPCDGRVVAGYGKILNIFGKVEEKKEGNEVFAGDVVKAGKLSVKLTKTFKESFLVSSLNSLKQTKLFTPRISTMLRGFSKYLRIFVLVVGIALAAWKLYEGNVDGAVLMLSSSLILLSFTPAYITSLQSSIFPMLFEKGVLVRRGESLEKLKGVKFLLIPEGLVIEERKVKKIVEIEGNESDVALMAKTAGRLHPIFKHLFGAGEEKVPLVSNYRVFPDGIEAEYLGRKIVVGSRRFVESRGFKPVYVEGDNVLFVGYGEKLLGAVVMEEKVREDAKRMIESLKDVGIIPVLISERGEEVVKLCERVGVERYCYGLTEDKLKDCVAELKKEGKVCALGLEKKVEGVDVTIQFGKEGEEDILLVSKDLEKIVYMFQLLSKLEKDVRNLFLLNFILLLTALSISILYTNDFCPVIAQFSVFFGNLVAKNWKVSKV